MKILKVSCEQFAGIRDFEVEFKDGINIVFGANESGKSSLVNILTETLLKAPSLNRGTIVDKNFIESFFPSVTRTDDEKGNFIDGSVMFETQNGVFTLSKKWRNDGGGCSITLILPNGDRIDNYDAVKKLLDVEFQSRDAILREILLSQQTVNLESLEKLINNPAALESSTEIISALTKLYAEAGVGLSISDIEKNINEKIDNLGKYWNKEKDAPAHKKYNGAISEVYKKLEHLNESAQLINHLEGQLIKLDENFKKINASALEARARFERFRNIEVQLQKCISERRRLEDNLKNFLDKRKIYAAAVKDWPALEEQLRSAEDLDSDFKSAVFQRDMQSFKQLLNSIRPLQQELEKLPSPEKIAQDIKIAERANDIIMQCIGKLKGLDLTLKVKILNSLNEKKLEIFAASNGALIKPSSNDNGDSVYNINRAVIIKIPDIAQMQITGGSVNIDAVKAEWEKNKAIVHEIIARYNLGELHSIDAIRDKLMALMMEGDKKRNELKKLESERDELHKRTQDILNRIHGRLKISDIDNDNDGKEDNRTIEDITKEIKYLGTEPEKLELFIHERRSKIDMYVQNYNSFYKLEDMSARLDLTIRNANTELSKIKEQLNNIPDEFKKADTRSELENALAKSERERDNAIKLMQNCRRDLEHEQKERGNSEQIESAIQQAKTEFENKKNELAHWENILKIFNKTKDELKKNPLDFLMKKFSLYLETISAGRLASENASSALKPKIYSKDRVLNWLNISEGTKETIALAFRLAVIDNLYQDGGAVTVFDDPLANMDAERAEQACKLIKKFAENNQVIFLTCHKEYQEILGGNLIELK